MPTLPHSLQETGKVDQFLTAQKQNTISWEKLEKNKKKPWADEFGQTLSPSITDALMNSIWSSKTYLES